MLPAWLGYVLFAAGFVLAVTAIVITVVPALPRIRAAFRREVMPETPAQRWRRVHVAGDRGRAFERSR